MKRFAALAVLSAVCSVNAGQASNVDSLSTFAGRLAAAMVKDDWPTFRRMATASIAIEEHWNAYDDYLVKMKGQQGSLGWHSQKSLEYRTVILNKPEIPKNHLVLFRAYCKQIRKARDRMPNRDWLTAESSHGRSVADSYNVATPHLIGKIASNVDVVIEVVRTTDGWRAQRLMLVGH